VRNDCQKWTAGGSTSFVFSPMGMATSAGRMIGTMQHLGGIQVLTRQYGLESALPIASRRTGKLIGKGRKILLLLLFLHRYA
jgi:hypothetical protein